MHDYDEDRTEQSVYAVLNLKQNLRSMYCSEANDTHEASRGLFATAELLVHCIALTVSHPHAQNCMILGTKFQTFSGVG